MSTEEERRKHESALAEFNKAASVTGVNEDVLDVLRFIGETGRNCYSWGVVQPLLRCRLEQVLTTGCAVPNSDQEVFESNKENAIAALLEFQEAPFTLQRLCEVLLHKETVEGRKVKLVWALLKLLNIRSTLPVEKFPYEDNADAAAAQPLTAPTGIPAESEIPLPPAAPTPAKEEPPAEKEPAKQE